MFGSLLAKIFGSRYRGYGRVNERNNIHLFVFVTQLTLSASLNKFWDHALATPIVKFSMITENWY